MIILIMGPPGSGKGEQSRLLANKLNGCCISVGDVLRKYNDSTIDNTMKSGCLVDDDIVERIVFDAIKNNDCVHYIVDGFPRNVRQAIDLLKFIKDELNNDMILGFIAIDVPDDIVFMRILNRRVCSRCGMVYNTNDMVGLICDKCGGELTVRADDTEDVLKKRLAIYKENISKIIDFFTQNNVNGNIVDGTKSKYVVMQEILNCIYRWSDNFIVEILDSISSVKRLLEESEEKMHRVVTEKADVDMTLPLLETYLSQGYDRVTWMGGGECRQCQAYENKTWDLEWFIKNAKHAAPIYSITHPGCQCVIKVWCSDKTKELQPVYMNNQGEVEY